MPRKMAAVNKAQVGYIVYTEYRTLYTHRICQSINFFFRRIYSFFLGSMKTNTIIQYTFIEIFDLRHS